MDISSLRDTVLDGRTKGIPGTASPFKLSEIGTKGWNVLREDMPLPLMVLKRANLDHNAQVFGEYLTEHDLSLAPHGKTTMAPQIFAEQLDSGAWGMTAATVNQMLVMNQYGVRRIILANQLLGKAHVEAVAATINADPEFSFYCFVDSVALLGNISRHLNGAQLASPIRLLIEVGVDGGRTGVRTTRKALEIANAIAEADESKVRFAGVAAFEGVVPGADKDPALISEFAQKVVDVAAALPAGLFSDLDEFLLTGGGSSYFDLVAERFKDLSLPVPVRVLLRSGCYITHDSGTYKSAQDIARDDPARSWKSALQPALEAWAYVQSRPEPELALLTMGKRDVPYDAGLPMPLKLYRPGTGFLDVGTAEIFALNDQHAFVRLHADSGWQVGDMVCSGISHPCTAFDKWRFLPVVNDDYDVIDGVLTMF
ncbi:MAG: amino acid deaminase [Pseudomonadota bacterium]